MEDRKKCSECGRVIMDVNLVELFKKKMDDPNLSSDFTWDDFFDEAEIPLEARNNFVIGCILKQYYYPEMV